MHALRICLACALLVGGCTAPVDPVARVDAPILGGTEATVGQFPTVVAILNKNLCTGTLVAPDVVLTAAHCVLPSVGGYATQAALTADTVVVLDTVDLHTAGGRTIAAADTIPHPEFDINALGSHDVGIVLLAETVDDRTPTPINRTHSDAPPGIHTALAGFGMTRLYFQSSAGWLDFIADKASTTCDPSIGSDADLLCFDQRDGKGSCSGDSGGPAFASIHGVVEVVGVTSFGDKYCRLFGAYTRPEAELAFLETYLPAPSCVADGTCVAECGTGSFPVDPDCAACAADGACNAACGKGSLPADPDCPSCAPDGTCEPACGTGGLPTDPDCPACTVDADCGDPSMVCLAGQCAQALALDGGAGVDAGPDADAGVDAGAGDGNHRGRCAVGPVGAPTTGALPWLLIAIGLGVRRRLRA